MKLLIVTGLYPPNVGGPATYSYLLHTELPQHGVDVSVVTFDSVRFLPTGIRHAVFLLMILIKGRGKDLLYAQDPVSVGFPAMIAARWLKKPFALKVVGDYAWEQGTQRFGVEDMLDFFVGKKRGSYNKRVERLRRVQERVAQAAAHIIVPSQYLKKIVTEWGVDAEKVTVVYNAHNDDNVLSVLGQYPTKITAQEALDVASPMLVTVGRLVPWKGFVTLLVLMPQLIKQFPGISLHIIGSGPMYAYLSDVVKKAELGKHVFVHGALPQKEAFVYIRAADAFVLNTAYEGFSHQLLEVLALGTPIITTDVGGNPEIITDGKNGLLVPHDDKDAISGAIVKILNGELNIDTMVDAGRTASDVYTEERMLSETVAVLKKCV